MSDILPTWIDCYINAPELGDVIAVRPRDGGGWRVCLDEDPGPKRVFMRVVKVVRQPAGHYAAKVELHKDDHPNEDDFAPGAVIKDITGGDVN